MKRMERLMFVILFWVFSLAVFGQKPKVAVYVTGNQNAGIHKVLGDKLVASFVTNGGYQAIERSANFLAELGREQSYQQTGVVNDHDIARLGKQFGVQFVCVVDVLDIFNTQYLSVRLIDVESAEIVRTANTARNLTDMPELTVAANTITASLMKRGVGKIDKEKVAIYVTGGETAINKVIGDKLVEVFVNSNRYVAVERTAHFLAELGREQKYQQTGQVDDQEISRLGQQFGAQWVCVADVSDVFSEKYISVRLINVENATILKTANVSSPLNTMENLLSAIRSLGNTMTELSLRELEMLSEKAYLQTEEEVPVFFYRENALNVPKFQEGDLVNFLKWCTGNVVYPDIDIENGIQGRVVATFVIKRNGEIGRIKIANTPSETLAKAVFDVLLKAPKWTIFDPMANWNVTLPFTFKFAESESTKQKRK